jgi:hypothetical protein
MLYFVQQFQKDEKKSKIDPKVNKCIFIGYSLE